jgi:formylglycine-generating enzyme required for sulfatase activity
LDLAGNAWDWCLNQYDRFRDLGTEGDESRVVRGGAWYVNPDLARAAFRRDRRPRDRGSKTPTPTPSGC